MLRFLVGLSLAVIVLASPARAGSLEDCNQTRDVDRKISGCTKFIRENNPRDAGAYNNRGLGYIEKGDFDRAISDFNKAIEIDPKLANAYHNRGFSYYGKGDYDRAIADFNKAIEINPKHVNAYDHRGEVYTDKGDYDRAITDYNKAIEIDPKKGVFYNNRGLAYDFKGEYDRAIADYNKAIEINPKLAGAYNNRGLAYDGKGDFDRAIGDLNKAIEIDPKIANAYSGRGFAYNGKGDYDRAIADLDKAIEIDAKFVSAYKNRGWSYYLKGDHDRAIAELSEALRLDSKNSDSFTKRATVYETKGQTERAIADYRVAIGLTPRSYFERKVVEEARARLAALEAQKQRPQQPEFVAPAPVASPGRRIALVIGNSAYANAGRLNNPGNDARAMAASFRRLGFAEVIERYDTDLAAMTAALKNFGDRTTDADWAVVYYSGHGLEMNGIAYLIPVDAKLERDTHVTDETVALSRVLEKVESAHKLRLVILDACRNNPFVSRMIRSVGVSRAIGRGLAPIEPEGGVLVAYAAKHGTMAEDGSGANSPFAEAMLANLEEPGLEIQFLFRRVRDEVLARTNRRQEPFLYGSLPSESLFFKAAVQR